MNQPDLLARMRTQVVGPDTDIHKSNGSATQQAPLRHQNLQNIILVDAVVFDNDGVCVNSEVHAMRSALKVTEELFRRKGLVPPEEEAFMRLAGKPYALILQALSTDFEPRLKLSSDEIQALVLEEEERAQAALRVHATAIPGIIHSLDIIKSLKLPYAMASTSRRERIDVCLEAGHLTDYFPREKVFSAISDFLEAKPKPQPYVYHKALDYLREISGKPLTNLARVVAIEDSPSGVGAAVNAGIPYVVGFLGGDHIPHVERPSRSRKLMDLGCYTVIDDMYQFPSILNKIGTEIALATAR